MRNRISNDFCFEEEKRFTRTDEFAEMLGPKGTASCYEIDRFKDVRFSLRVVSIKDVELGRKLNFRFLVVAEVP